MGGGEGGRGGGRGVRGGGGGYVAWELGTQPGRAKVRKVR